MSHLLRFINFDGFLPIPLTGNLFYINSFGKILDNSKQEIEPILNENGDQGVVLDIWEEKRFYKTSLLVAVTFKSLKVNPKLWKSLDVFHLDNNRENYHPSNLVWKFPKGGLLHSKYKDFAYIPGFSKYVINKDGCVIFTMTGKILQPFFEEGYAKFRLSPDIGKNVCIGRHRLLALAWLEYPSYVVNLVVNHKDGIPGNDSLDNLEWVTRRENNTHAAKTNLLTKGRAVLVKNCETGEILKFNGTSHCAQYYGLNRSTIRYRLLAKNQPLYAGNLLFKYEYDHTPFREITVLQKKKLNTGTKVGIKVYNIKTKEVKEFDSAVDAAEFYSIPVTSIHASLRVRKKTRPYKCLCFKYLNDNSPWPEYTVSEVKFFEENQMGKQTGIYLKNAKTGEEEIFSTFSDLEKRLNLSRYLIVKHIKSKTLINGIYEIK